MSQREKIESDDGFEEVWARIRAANQTISLDSPDDMEAQERFDRKLLKARRDLRNKEAETFYWASQQPPCRVVL